MYFVQIKATFPSGCLKVNNQVSNTPALNLAKYETTDNGPATNNIKIK